MDTISLSNSTPAESELHDEDSVQGSDLGRLGFDNPQNLSLMELAEKAKEANSDVSGEKAKTQFVYSWYVVLDPSQGGGKGGKGIG